MLYFSSSHLSVKSLETSILYNAKVLFSMTIFLFVSRVYPYYVIAFRVDRIDDDVNIMDQGFINRSTFRFSFATPSKNRLSILF